MVKISILYKFTDEAWGGGNQFLKVLRKFLVEKAQCYEADPQKADIILVNSKDSLEAAAFLSGRGKTVIHRIDGVFSIYRGDHERKTDCKVYDFNKNVADGTIFQSNWSREASKQNGMEHKRFETVIRNCSDSEIFSVNRKHRGMYRWQGRYRLVTTCWSENPKKGFDIYKHLDDELDFDKYEYTFIGRSPIQFKNINNIGVLTTPEIGLNLRNSDIFVTATQDDTCSNSLIEAMSRGMPAVGLASGGTPEIIGEGGELFSSKLDVIDQIDKVSKSIVEYENKVDIPLASTVCYRYMEFMKEVHKYVVSQH